MAKAKKSTAKAATVETGDHYQEWKVEVKAKKDGEETVREAEKLKMVRPCVKISEAEAEVLNNGALYGPTTIALMYFKAEGSEEKAEEPADLLD